LLKSHLQLRWLIVPAVSVETRDVAQVACTAGTNLPDQAKRINMQLFITLVLLIDVSAFVGFSSEGCLLLMLILRGISTSKQIEKK